MQGHKNFIAALWAVEGGRSTGTKCGMVKSLKQWEEEMQKEVIRLHCIKERGPERDNYPKQDEIVMIHGTDFQGLPNDVNSE